MDLSDRIAVIYKGSIQRVLDKSRGNQRIFGILMAGLSYDKGFIIAFKAVIIFLAVVIAILDGFCHPL